MQKLLSFFVTLTVCLTICAQESDHLTFKGIPINGTLQVYVQKLKNAGFTFSKYSDTGTIAFLNGTFTGKPVEVIVVASPKTKTVWKVSVYYPEQVSWYTIKNDYFEMVASLTQKYGNPTDNFEFFSDPYYEGDGYEMQAIRMEKCHYISAFETSKGVISCEISKHEQLNVTYEDSLNTAIMKRERNNAVQEDL